MKKRNILLSGAVLLGALALTGCSMEATPDNGNSDADKAQYNLKMAAEQFEVQRTIIGQSGISDKVFLYVEGRCSFEYPSDNRVDIICKRGPNEYSRDTAILGDQDRVFLVQEETIDVSVYHTRVVIKPESILPEFDIEVGKQ